MNADTHKRQILAHMRKGLTITAGQALALFRCSRLAARIFDLKADGHNINSTRVKTPSGKWVAQYSLVQEATDV